jgi:flavin reductase (DIM6/NTAB) family NADH-FMN oxidoreductase RutF
LELLPRHLENGRRAITTFEEIPDASIHHALGPRTAFLIGSERENGVPHLCAASNVTNVGISPQIIAVGLWPTWETTNNIQRTGEFTVNLMDVADTDNIWIVGSKYSKVSLLPEDDKFLVGGFSPLPSVHVKPYGVSESLAVLECRVERVIDDLSDHIIFLAHVISARCDRQYFDEDYIIDVHRVHPVMQISSRYFAQCAPSPVPDTAWCTKLAAQRRESPGSEAGLRLRSTRSS